MAVAGTEQGWGRDESPFRVQSPARPRAGVRLRARAAFRHAVMSTTNVAAVAVAWLVTGLLDPAVSHPWHSFLVVISSWWLMAEVNGLDQADARRIYSRSADELPRIAGYGVATAVVAGLFVPALDHAHGTIFVLASLAAALSLRTVARSLWRRVVEPERALIVGHGPLCQAVMRKLAIEPGHHTQILLTDRGSSVADLAELQGEVDRVIVAREDLGERPLEEIVAACRAANLKLSVAPSIHAALGSAAELTHVAELPLIEYRTWRPSQRVLVLKRAFDTAVSAVAIILLLPLALTIALAIKLDSPGPVLFRQRRAGRDGRPFGMLKFRSMVLDAERRLPEVVELDRLEQPVYKVPGDPRVTRAGRLLRRTSLDELPQLVNVLVGEMSIVGPRPEDVRLVQRYDDAAMIRLEARPGITGPMQVHGRGDLTFEERLSVEREYVENYSIGKDLRLLLRTASAVFTGRGAY